METGDSVERYTPLKLLMLMLMLMGPPVAEPPEDTHGPQTHGNLLGIKPEPRATFCPTGLKLGIFFKSSLKSLGLKLRSKGEITHLVLEMITNSTVVKSPSLYGRLQSSSCSRARSEPTPPASELRPRRFGSEAHRTTVALILDTRVRSSVEFPRIHQDDPQRHISEIILMPMGEC